MFDRQGGLSVDAAERTAAWGDGGRRALKTLFRWGSVWETLSLPSREGALRLKGAKEPWRASAVLWLGQAEWFDGTDEEAS